jgi:hypothetical protein
MKHLTKAVFCFIFVVFMACGTLNIGNVPWQLDIQNWSVHQRANFFMTTWLAEKHSYDTLNAMEDKSEDLIKVLKAKREILEQSRVPIRMYVQIVNSGVLPGPESEQEIINWLRQLQQQIIYGG